MATVVVVLPVLVISSSTPTLAWVMIASLRSGSISEIAPTKVVLPTPKPPATTILTGVSLCLEALDSIEHLLEQRRIGVSLEARRDLAGRFANLDGTSVRKIGHHDPHHSDRNIKAGGDLDD